MMNILKLQSAFSTNAFSLNVLLTFTSIYLQSIVNTSNLFYTFVKESKYIENDIGVIRIKPIVSE